MRDTASKALLKITKGALIIILGTFVGNLFAFLARLFIIRNISVAEFGVLSLTLTIVNISVAVATLGLKQGIARYIGFFRARKDLSKMFGVVKSSVEISVLTGFVFCVLVFFLSPAFASLFSSPTVNSSLRIYAWAIPFLLLIEIFCAIYRGFGRADIKIFFQNILRNLILLLGLVIVWIVGFSLMNVLFAYIASAVVTVALFASVSLRKFLKSKSVQLTPMKKVLLSFSLPLLVRTFLGNIMTWSDVLMVGYFLDDAAIGLYNAALSLVNYLPILLTSASFLYIPLMTEFYAKDLWSDINRNYVVLTKWIFIITFPLFAVLFLYPSAVLRTLFGAEYTSVAVVLSILSVGFMINSILGPNGATLTVLGRTRFIMWSSVIGTTLNLLLNIFLIPLLGNIGAALASSISLVFLNLLVSIELWRLGGIHPFRRSYFMPLVVVSILTGVVFASTFWLNLSGWPLILILLGFGFISLVSLAITRSFDNEDLLLVQCLENKLRINLGFVKKIVMKFKS